MSFFAMGLGIEGKLAFRSDYQTATIGDYYSILTGTGGVNWPAVANLDPTGVDDLWHATVNGRGKYFSARNVPNVVAGLREALNKIGARVGSAAAAATSNLEPVPGDNFAYVASYQTQDWVGDLQSRSINVATGDVSPETNCSASGVQTAISGSSGSSTITVTDTTDLVVGAAVTGTGIATGAVVTAISGLGITLSQANTGAVSGTGTFKYGCQWSAQAKLEATTWSARRIYVKPSSGTSGDPLRAFTYGNLSGAERAYFNPGPDACVGAANPVPTTNLSQYCPLGGIASVPEMTTSNLVDFLRGDRGYEQDGELGHAQVWRNRARVLGDIVNTQPIFIKAPSAGYTDTGYSAFKTAQASRKPLVVVSSQDGMVHAFNAYSGSVTVNGTAVGPGEEMWAFMPTEAMQNMKWLADANYSHRFLVDGLIAVGDVDFGSNDWRTIMVGGLGSGGSSYYALDITDPTNPTYLWEFSHANLGKTYSNVAITKLHTGEWTVMFSSGYNNTSNGGDGAGHLFAINPRTGALMSGFPISNLSGTSGSPSNLGKITPWADNPATNNTTQFVYAGDTNGDLWRFDMDPTGTGHTGSQVFKLAHLENAGVPQAITTKPELTLLQDNVRLIMVGTGKYLEVSDLTNTDIQAVYAIKDTMGAANMGGVSQLTWNPTTDMLPSDPTKPMFLERKLISVDQSNDPITHTDSYGVTSVHRKICAGSAPTVTSSGSPPNLTYTCTGTDSTALDYSVHGGWYARLPDSGERINVDPRIISGTLIFASNVPAADACTVGGNAWFTAVDAATGLAIEEFASTKVSGALVVGLTVIRLSTGEFKAIATRSDYKQETLSVPVAATAAVSNTFQSKRGLWREFEAY
jgi:type IV pilus assembly protein PilY1